MSTLSDPERELLLALADEQERYEARRGWDFRITLWSRVSYRLAAARGRLQPTHISGKFDLERGFEVTFRRWVDRLVRRGLVRFRAIGPGRPQPRQTLGYKSHEARLRDLFLTAAGRSRVAQLRGTDAAAPGLDREHDHARAVPTPDGDPGRAPAAPLPDGDPGRPSAPPPASPTVNKVDDIGDDPIVIVNIIDIIAPATGPRAAVVVVDQLIPARTDTLPVRPRRLVRPHAERPPRRPPAARPRATRHPA